MAFPLVAVLASPTAYGSGGGFEVDVDWSEDVPLALAGTALWLTLAGLEDQIVLDQCGWCAGPGPVDRGVRNALIAPDIEAASVASSVIGWGVLPMTVLVSDILSIHLGERDWIELAEDLTIIAESFVAAAFVTQLVKMSVRRPRPFSHYDTAASEHGNDLLSFFSGHTSMTASVAASAATLAFLRGHASAPWVALTGGALVLTVGGLRIASDRHYFTDVLVGLIVGTGIGIAVPFLHANKGNVIVAPGVGSLVVLGTF
jgi:membrane-associated phospholipid phosphatase